jgi:hypothetical protein
MIEQASTNTPVASGVVTVYYRYPDGHWGYTERTGYRASTTWRA